MRIYKKFFITLILVIISITFLSCSTKKQVQQTKTQTNNNTVTMPLQTHKPGFNEYGIPSSEMWRLTKEDGSKIDNLNDVILQIKKEKGIPECITGIPFDDKAKNLLLDKNGQLVDNWEEVLQQLKSEWGVN